MFFQAADVYRNVFPDSLRQPILYQVMLRCLTDSYTSDKPPVGMTHSLNLQTWWLYPSTSHPFCWLSCKIYLLPLNFHAWSPVMYQRMYQLFFKVFIPYQDSWPASVNLTNNAKAISEQVARLASQPCTTRDTPTWLYIFLHPQKWYFILKMFALFFFVPERCLRCSFCACCAFTIVAMITWPLYLKMLALFFSELDEIFESLLLRWKLAADDLVWDSKPAADMKAGNWRNRATWQLSY